MSWRDVPMPTAVRSLPTDKRGFPVPWVSCWDGPRAWDPLTWQVTETPDVLLECLASYCGHVAGEGVPDLGQLCPGNQLQGMVHRLCDVCGGPIPEGPIYFMGGYDAAKGKAGFRECGLHFECALYAGQVCPALVTSRPPATVVVYECTTYDLQPIFYWTDSKHAIQSDHFASFDDPDLVALFILTKANGTRMALIGALANPVDPIITPLADWLAVHVSQRENA